MHDVLSKNGHYKDKFISSATVLDLASPHYYIDSFHIYLLLLKKYVVCKMFLLMCYIC